MSIKESIKILVVDDMSVSRGLVTRALDNIGIKQYSWETDGSAAFERLVNKAPAHLVISDYEMPKMNGLDLLECLRGHATTKNIGFLLVTGSTDKTVIDRGMKLGMNNYLKKPFTDDQLRKCLESVVGKL